MRRLRWLSLGLVALVMLLLAPTLWREREQLMSFEWHIAPLWLVFAGLMHAVTMGWSFVVWHLTVRRLAGVAAPGLRADFSIYYTTLLARRIPGSVWYAAGRVWLYERVGVGRSVTLAALVLEAAIIFVSGVVFVLGLLPLADSGENRLSPLLASIPSWLLPLGVVVGLVVLWPGVLERLINWVRAWRHLDALSFNVGYLDLVVWVGLTLIVWLAAGLGFYGVVRFVYPAPLTDLAPLLLISTISILVGFISFLLPFIPLAKEFAMSLLLTAFVPLPVAIVVTILYRVVWTACDALWALIAGHFGNVALLEPGPTAAGESVSPAPQP